MFSDVLHNPDPCFQVLLGHLGKWHCGQCLEHVILALLPPRGLHRPKDTDIKGLEHVGGVGRKAYEVYVVFFRDLIDLV